MVKKTKKNPQERIKVEFGYLGEFTEKHLQLNSIQCIPFNVELWIEAHIVSFTFLYYAQSNEFINICHSLNAQSINLILGFLFTLYAESITQLFFEMSKSNCMLPFFDQYLSINITLLLLHTQQTFHRYACYTYLNENE